MEKSSKVLSRFLDILAEECWYKSPVIILVDSKEVYYGFTEYTITYKLSNGKLMEVVFKHMVSGDGDPTRKSFNHIKSYDGLQFPVAFSAAVINERGILLENPTEIISVKRVLEKLYKETFNMDHHINVFIEALEEKLGKDEHI